MCSDTHVIISEINYGFRCFFFYIFFNFVCTKYIGAQSNHEFMPVVILLLWMSKFNIFLACLLFLYVFCEIDACQSWKYAKSKTIEHFEWNKLNSIQLYIVFIFIFAFRILRTTFKTGKTISNAIFWCIKRSFGNKMGKTLHRWWITNYWLSCWATTCWITNLDKIISNTNSMYAKGIYDFL